MQVRKIKGRAGRAILQPATEGIEHLSEIVLVVVDAVVFVAQPGVHRKVRTDLEFVQNVSVVRILARLRLDWQRAVTERIQLVVEKSSLAEISEALQ